MLGMARDDEASNGLHWGWSGYLSTNISLSNMMSVNNKQTISQLSVKNFDFELTITAISH